MTLRHLAPEPLPLPDDAGRAVRVAHGLADGAPLRIAYVPGPGDVVGTFRHWQTGRHDPRVPVRTYSAMFYDLAAVLGAKAHIVTAAGQSEPLPLHAPPFSFARVTPMGASPRAARRDRVRQTEAAIDAFDPHIVLLSSDYPWQLRPRAAWRRPAYLSLHNTLWPMGRDDTLRARLRRLRLRPAAAQWRGAVCTSAECARQLHALLPQGRPALVEMPQAAWHIAPRTRTEARRFLCVGRIVEAKGVLDLADAFAMAGPDMPGATLDFVGDGPALETLRQRAAASGAPIGCHGRLEAEGVHEALAAADVLVCPTCITFPEGLALTCLEAAQHGVPSLLSDVVPAAETLGDGALVFPADDTEALARALRRLHDDGAEVTRRSKAAARAASAMGDLRASWGMCLYRLLSRTA